MLCYVMFMFIFNCFPNTEGFYTDSVKSYKLMLYMQTAQTHQLGPEAMTFIALILKPNVHITIYIAIVR